MLRTLASCARACYFAAPREVARFERRTGVAGVGGALSRAEDDEAAIGVAGAAGASASMVSDAEAGSASTAGTDSMSIGTAAMRSSTGSVWASRALFLTLDFGVFRMPFVFLAERGVAVGRSLEEAAGVDGSEAEEREEDAAALGGV
jgi:hypothetical protein